MKRKRWLLLICAVLIAALLIGVLAACDPGSKEQGGSQTPGGTQLPGNGGGGGTQTPGDNDQDDEQGGSQTPGDDGLGGDVGSVVTSPDGIVFTNIGGSYSVTGYEGTDTKVVIPETYEGLPVTSIGSYAFEGCTSLTSVTIPDSVTSIGSYAFEGCDNLQYNEYDNALYLGNDENQYVVLIKAKNQSIASVNINASTKLINNEAFRSCESLTSVTIPDSVTSIEDSAFDGCTSLTSVTIPDGVTSIGDVVFRNCDSLTSVTIPSSVTSIGSYAFEGCYNLQYNEYDNALYLGNDENQYVVLIKAKDLRSTSMLRQRLYTALPSIGATLSPLSPSRTA